MVFAIDFDGTLVEQDKPYADTWSEPKLKPGAVQALVALKAAGHVLVLWSGRNNKSRVTLAELDPLVRAGVRPDRLTDASRQIEADRYRQMTHFIEQTLPGLFDAIDDGRCGKIAADVFVDDKAIQFGGAGGATWADIARTYGE